MTDYRPRGERASIICTGCGVTIATRPAGDGPGTGRCSRCAARAQATHPMAVPGSAPVPGTRALRRRAFGVRKSRAGRLSPADRRRAADLGLETP